MSRRCANERAKLEGGSDGGLEGEKMEGGSEGGIEGEKKRRVVPRVELKVKKRPHRDLKIHRFSGVGNITTLAQTICHK